MRTRSALLLATAAVLTACTGRGATTTPEAARPRNADAAPAFTPGLAPTTDHWARAPLANLQAVADVGSSGTGAQTVTSTRLLLTDATGTRTRFETGVPGGWALPVPVPLGDTEGLSRDGRLVVLQSTDAPGVFLLIRPGAHAGRRRIVDLSPRGRLGFAAMAPDGGSLYLVQYRDARGRATSTLVVYDVARGRLARIRDRTPGAETTAGTPTARTVSADGRIVVTVYETTQRPFVLVLDTVRAASARVDLPVRSSVTSTAPWELVLRGGRLVATSAALHRAFAVELRGTPHLR